MPVVLAKSAPFQPSSQKNVSLMSSQQGYNILEAVSEAGEKSEAGSDAFTLSNSNI
jgi:hypothetical protein